MAGALPFQRPDGMWLPTSSARCALVSAAAVGTLFLLLAVNSALSAFEVQDLVNSLFRQSEQMSERIAKLEKLQPYQLPPGATGCPARAPYPYRDDIGKYLNACCSEPINCRGLPLSSSLENECCQGTIERLQRTYYWTPPAVEVTCQEYPWWDLLEGKGGPLWQIMKRNIQVDVWAGKESKLDDADVEQARFSLKSNRDSSGQRQLATARKYMELLPGERLLELGCGAMHAGEHFLPYLHKDAYVCVEPNEILHQQAARDHLWLAGNITASRARFVARDDFDPRPATGKDFLFDHSWSHSILSHAADWQLLQYFEVMKAVLKPDGVGMASIRFSDHEGKEMGPTHDTSWVYPGVSFFDVTEAKCMGKRVGLDVELVPEARLFMTKVCPYEWHDWIRFRHAAPTE